MSFATWMEVTTRSRKYERTAVVDRMKPWQPAGGVSDTDAESGGEETKMSN